MPVFVTAGTLFAERLLDAVILSSWILFGALADRPGRRHAPHRSGALVGSSARRRSRRARRPAIPTRPSGLPGGRRAGCRPAGTRASPAPQRTSLTGWAPFAAARGSWPSSGVGCDVARRRDHVLRWSASSRSSSTCRSAPTSCSRGSGTSRWRSPPRPPGSGRFDYLTLLAAKGIDVNPDKATAYVLTMHALAVLPVTIMGAVLVSPAFPRLLGRRREPAQESG